MKAVAVFSGGLDSTVMLADMMQRGWDVRALTFDYGQRHRREIASAKAVAERLDVAHEVVNLRALTKLMRGSALTDDAVPVPDGHYAEESMKATVVPNRNMVMLAVAGAAAVADGAGMVAFAVHRGDHAIYPDCREEFVRAMTGALALCDWKPPVLHAPFVRWGKRDIVRLGHDLVAPLDLTWSCYKGGDAHCGTCGTCVERREAFALAGVDDPTVYEVPAEA